MIEFEEARDAAKVIANYAVDHPIRTRRWRSVFVGITEQLTDSPIAEFEDIYSVVIESKSNNRSSNRDRRTGSIVLESAGFEKVPLVIAHPSEDMVAIGYLNKL